MKLKKLLVIVSMLSCSILVPLQFKGIAEISVPSAAIKNLEPLLAAAYRTSREIAVLLETLHHKISFTALHMEIADNHSLKRGHWELKLASIAPEVAVTGENEVPNMYAYLFDIYFQQNKIGQLALHTFKIYLPFELFLTYPGLSDKTAHDLQSLITTLNQDKRFQWF